MSITEYPGKSALDVAVIGTGGTAISPATEAKQDAANALLTSILAAGTAIDTAMTSVTVDLNAGAAQELVATPGAGHALWVYGYELHSGPVQGTIALLSAATSKTGTMQFGAGGGVARDGKYPIFKCAENEALNITVVDCTADGNVSYRDVTL